MLAKRTGGRFVAIGAMLALGLPLGSHAASAHSTRQPVSHTTHVANSRASYAGRYAHHVAREDGHAFHGRVVHAMWHGRRYSHYVAERYYDPLQCVAYAREVTGIDLSGNADTWWYHAEGLYERGNRPEAGAILNFRSTGRMRDGHVAVVVNVVNSRMVEIDQANWSPGISRNIPVVDVSPDNDWTQVRVGLGHTGEFGSVYPTYGFIYDRPDVGSLLAAHPTNANLPVMNAAPSDLPPLTTTADAAQTHYSEVAEAPAADEVSGDR
jgi:surface antigen